MNLIKVSVIIPSYKPKDYLWQNLSSMFSQTLRRDLYEIILVLNGCCEPWKSKIEEYIKKNGKGINIQFLHTDIPGVSNARNMGIDVAKGKFITFVDDDDYVSPSFLEGLLPLASPDTLALAYPFGFIDGNEQNQVPYVLTDAYNKYAPKGKQSFQNVLAYFQGPCMKLIALEIIGDRRFDTRFANGEDSLFMFAISNRFKYVNFAVKDSIYYRRHRGGSASRSQNSRQYISNGINLLKVYISIFLHNKGERYSIRFLLTRIAGTLHAISRAFI